MAQGKMPEAGAGAGARLGYSSAPFAVVQPQDLPEQLRRHVAGGGGGFYARAAGAHRDEGAERHLQQLLRAAHPAVVPEGQLAGVVSLPSDDPAVKFAAAFKTEEGWMRAWMEQFGGGAWDADVEMGAFYAENGGPARENAERIAALLRKNMDEDDAVPLLLDSNRSAEQDSLYHYDSGVLAPSLENLMPAWEATRSTTYYAVQVSVDAAAGAKAGDPIAVDVKADAGGEEEAGHEHDNLSAVVGIVAASSAATALSAGAVGPVMAFGLFAVLIGGLSLAMAFAPRRMAHAPLTARDVGWLGASGAWLVAVCFLVCARGSTGTE